MRVAESNETGRDVLQQRLLIRPIQERDLDEADRIMRIAFGTYLSVPNPAEAFGDADWVHTRYRTNPSAAFCAEFDGEVVGSNFATRWGSFGSFGPLTVRPELWNQGIASRLMEPIMQLFDSWGVRHAGLFTFPESVKHVGLYQKFGFWPQDLNPVLAKAVAGAAGPGSFTTFSAARAGGSDEAMLAHCRELAGAIYRGLDVESEIVAVEDQGLGETLLLEGDDLEGFAVCHCGGGSEAGSGACFVKFGAVRPGDGAEGRFERLVQACEVLAAQQGLAQLVAGVSTASHGAYEILLRLGYRSILNGVTMLRPNTPAFNRPDAYVISDLR
jgi:GNAT superfamily N-acetyltransferase